MQWNEQKSGALTKLTLRLAVAGYIVYLAWKILGGTLDGTSPIAGWLAYAICAVFFLFAIGSGIYSLREFRLALRAAAPIAENEEPPESQDQGTGRDEG